MTQTPLFRDRRDAGRALAARLAHYRGRDPLVLGLPRGGVVVAAEVARRLGADLDVVVARKLGSPISPELAIGAVTAGGDRFLNEDLIEELGVSQAYLNAATAARSVLEQRPARLVVAVPVGSREACAAMRGEADEVVCLHQPTYFGAVGSFYLDFEQTEDEDVRRLLDELAPAHAPYA